MIGPLEPYGSLFFDCTCVYICMCLFLCTSIVGTSPARLNISQRRKHIYNIHILDEAIRSLGLWITFVAHMMSLTKTTTMITHPTSDNSHAHYIHTHTHINIWGKILLSAFQLGSTCCCVSPKTISIAVRRPLDHLYAPTAPQDRSRRLDLWFWGSRYSRTDRDKICENEEIW